MSVICLFEEEVAVDVDAVAEFVVVVVALTSDRGRLALLVVGLPSTRAFLVM